MFQRDSILFRSLAVSAVVASMAALPIAAQTSDEEIGAEVAKKVEEEIGIYRTPVTSDYVEAIGFRLVGNLEDSQFSFQFNIVDQFDPNAFAVPAAGSTSRVACWCSPTARMNWRV